MKPTELRLGNLLHDREGRLCRVEQLSFDKDEFHAPAIKGALTGLPHKPIPIDEKILIACGFYTIEDGWYSIEYYHIELNWNIYDKRVRAMGNTIYHIEFLHQLQNLFYCLCGQELELKNEL